MSPQLESSISGSRPRFKVNEVPSFTQASLLRSIPCRESCSDSSSLNPEVEYANAEASQRGAGNAILARLGGVSLHRPYGHQSLIPRLRLHVRRQDLYLLHLRTIPILLHIRSINTAGSASLNLHISNVDNLVYCNRRSSQLL